MPRNRAIQRPAAGRADVAEAARRPSRRGPPVAPPPRSWALATAARGQHSGHGGASQKVAMFSWSCSCDAAANPRSLTSKYVRAGWFNPAGRGAMPRRPGLYHKSDRRRCCRCPGRSIRAPRALRARFAGSGACSERASSPATIGVANDVPRISLETAANRAASKPAPAAAKSTCSPRQASGSTRRFAVDAGDADDVRIRRGKQRRRGRPVVADGGDQQEPARGHRAHEAGQQDALRADQADVHDRHFLARHPVELDREQRQRAAAVTAEDVGGIQRRARDHALEPSPWPTRSDATAVPCGAGKTAPSQPWRTIFAPASTGCDASTPLSIKPMRRPLAGAAALPQRRRGGSCFRLAPASPSPDTDGCSRTALRIELAQLLQRAPRRQSFRRLQHDEREAEPRERLRAQHRESRGARAFERLGSRRQRADLAAQDRLAVRIRFDGRALARAAVRARAACALPRASRSPCAAFRSPAP